MKAYGPFSKDTENKALQGTPRKGGSLARSRRGDAIFATKNPRRNGEVFEIDNKSIYIVFKMEKGVLSVINAKRK